MFGRDELANRKAIRERRVDCKAKITAARKELEKVELDCKHPEEKLHRSRSKYDGGDEYECVDCGQITGRSLF